jgi:hypothetical protein
MSEIDMKVKYIKYVFWFADLYRYNFNHRQWQHTVGSNPGSNYDVVKVYNKHSYIWKVIWYIYPYIVIYCATRNDMDDTEK